MIRHALLLIALIPCAALAQQAGFEIVAEDVSPAGSVRLPRGPYDTNTVPDVQNGRVTRQALQRAGSSLTSQQIVDPFVQGFAEEGFETVFACADRECGGFDFRFQLDLLPEPEMHVDLGDFRYVLMETADDAVALVASRSQSTAFLQITRVGPAETTPQPPETVSNKDILPSAPPQTPLIETLEKTGSVTLEELDFASGSADLSDLDYASLSTLADWLQETPSARIALVGHTDAVGALEANVALSLRRAEAVRDRLIDVLSVNSEQLQAQGAGYLSPRASNLTDEGRARNRRVEAVLLSRD